MSLEKYNDAVVQVVAAIIFTAFVGFFVGAVVSAVWSVATCQSRKFYDMGPHRGLVCSDDLKR